MCSDKNANATLPFKVAPFCTRNLYQCSLAVLHSQGYEFVAGLEVEFYLFKLSDSKLSLQDAGWPGSAPEVELLNKGYQLLTEQRIDQLHEPLELLRTNLTAIGLPLLAMEIELGPSTAITQHLCAGREYHRSCPVAGIYISL